MENFQMENDIRLICVRALSFPEGIMEAHQTLHSFVPFSRDRRYFGISRSDEDGNIRYFAAAEIIREREAEESGLESIVLRSGEYASVVVKDYEKDAQSIAKAFDELTARPDIDPEGWCVEWYLNEKDVRCMVRLKQAVPAVFNRLRRNSPEGSLNPYC